MSSSLSSTRVYLGASASPQVGQRLGQQATQVPCFVLRRFVLSLKRSSNTPSTSV